MKQLALLVALAAGCVGSPERVRGQELPEVHVIATGGTIASAPGGGVSGEALIQALPGLDTLASVTVEEFSRVGSSQITPDHWRRLSARVEQVFRERRELAGVVVTHGTDTMEETAFFLDLTVGDPRPVVVTGAMRPARAVGPDGPANLWNAIRVAADPRARGRGTLVLLNDEIHAAHRVTKTNTTRVDAFVSPESGPVGTADPDGVVFVGPAHPPPLAGAFGPERAGTVLPRVEILYSYGGADGALLRPLGEGPVRGVVVATVGRGNLPEGQRDAVADLAGAGVVVVLSSRTNGGRVPVGRVRRLRAPGGDEASAEPARSPGGVFGAGALNAQKARVLLMLALARAGPAEEIADYFRRF